MRADRIFFHEESRQSRFLERAIDEVKEEIVELQAHAEGDDGCTTMAQACELPPDYADDSLEWQQHLIEQEEKRIEKALEKIRLYSLRKGRIALEKLARAQNCPTERESVQRCFANDLDAVIFAKYRPAPILKDGHRFKIDDWGSLEEGGASWREILGAAQEKIGEKARSCGRIDVASSVIEDEYVGSFFLVKGSMALTNRHVLLHKGLCRRTRDGSFGMAAHSTASLELGALYLKRLPQDAIDIEKIVHISQDWEMDCGLVGVDSPGHGCLELHPEKIDEDKLRGRLVYVVGHPFLDHRSPASEVATVFKGVFGVKRVMPGRLDKEKPLGEIDGLPVLNHDCSTLGGASGSCLIDLGPVDRANAAWEPSYGKVIGLHFGGKSGVGNYAVPSWELCEFLRKYLNA